MATTYKHVDAASEGGGDGSTWATSGGTAAYTEAEFEACLEGGAQTGYVYFVKGSQTYTLADSSYDASACDATAAEPCTIIGVKTATTNTGSNVVFSDWETIGSATRPTFACGASYTILLGDYFKVFNIIFTGAATFILTTSNYCIIYNCESTNSSGAASRTAFAGANSIFISCKAKSGAGHAFNVGASTKMIFCYAYESLTGYLLTAAANLLFNIADDCTTGFSESADGNILGFGNTIHNSTTGVAGTTGGGHAWINNIIDTATDGFKWTTQTDSNFFAYNHAGNSVTELYDTTIPLTSTELHSDKWETSGDPKFTNAAGHDFSLGSDSPCIDAGMTITLGVG